MAAGPGGRHRAGTHRATRRPQVTPSRLLLGAGLLGAPAAVALLTGMTSDERPARTAAAQAGTTAEITQAPTPSPSASRAVEVTRSSERNRAAASAPSARPQPKRPAEPDWLRACATAPAEVSNGALDTEYLCSVPDTGEQLTKDAARSWLRLATAYEEEFGEAPCITDSYRSLAAQGSLYARKPGLAARPGTSNHGWGVALDLCGGAESYATDEYAWLDANGHRFGWSNPGWARQSGARPEPWHWEHTTS